MKDKSPTNILLATLKHFALKVMEQEGKTIQLEQDYLIEIEGPNLFKVLQGGQVVAPFADIEELCSFIKMDMQLNEEG